MLRNVVWKSGMLQLGWILTNTQILSSSRLTCSVSTLLFACSEDVGVKFTEMLWKSMTVMKRGGMGEPSATTAVSIVVSTLLLEINGAVTSIMKPRFSVIIKPFIAVQITGLLSEEITAYWCFMLIERTVQAGDTLEAVMIDMMH